MQAHCSEGQSSSGQFPPSLERKSSFGALQIGTAKFQRLDITEANIHEIGVVVASIPASVVLRHGEMKTSFTPVHQTTVEYTPRKIASACIDLLLITGVLFLPNLAKMASPCPASCKSELAPFNGQSRILKTVYGSMVPGI